MSSSPYRDRIHRKLTAHLLPEHLEIRDESASHHGHAGHRPEGETHFFVRVISSCFDGQSRLQRQRTIYGILAEELDERVHALSLECLTPAEYHYR